MGGHFPQSRTYSLIMSSSEDSYARGGSVSGIGGSCAYCGNATTASQPQQPTDGQGRRRRAMKKSYSCDSECPPVPTSQRLAGLGLGLGLGGGTLSMLAARRRQLQRSCCSCSHDSSAGCGGGNSSTTTTTTTAQMSCTADAVSGLPPATYAFTSSSSVETRRLARPVWAADYTG